MGNCMSCDYYKEGVCSAYRIKIYILLEADECPAYAEKEGP